MKNELIKILAAYSLVLTILFVPLMVGTWNRDKTITRLEGNNRALLSDMEHYVTENNQQAWSIETLQLTLDQFYTLCDEQEEEIRALGIKLRRLESMSKTVTKTEVDTITKVVRDTLSPLPPMTESLPVARVSWSDPWVSLQVDLAGDNADVHVTSRDTLLQVVHRVPKRFLGIPYGVKGIRQEIVCSNPHTVIEYSEFIKITK